jgi:hypothetical protein
MTNKEFDAYLEERIQMIRNTLSHKAKEYANGKDRMHNFIVSAALQGCTPERALFGMMAKHLVSVADMVMELDDDTIQPKPEIDAWNEKIGDAVNYLCLLDAMIQERYAVRVERRAVDWGEDGCGKAHVATTHNGTHHFVPLSSILGGK